jgi:hypothetical protein
LLTNSVCPKSLSMLITKPSHPISIYFLQFTPLLYINIYPVYFHNFALPYPLTAEHSTLLLLTVSSPYPLRTSLSDLFSCHIAPYFNSSLSLQISSPSGEMFVIHTLSQPHSQTLQMYCNLGSLCSADVKEE